MTNRIHLWWEDKFITTVENNLPFSDQGEGNHTYGQVIL